MVGGQTRSRRTAKHFGAPKVKEAALRLNTLPSSLPSYNDALMNSGAWLILIDWHYSRFNTKDARTLMNEIGNLVDPLFKLYTAVNERGGWLNTTGLGEWKAIEEEVQLQDTKAMYEKYLFSFEKAYDPLTAYYARDANEQVQIQDIRPELLETLPIYKPLVSGIIDMDFWRQIEASDVVLLRGFDKVFNLDHSLFDVSRLIEEYPDFEVDVLTQTRNTRFVKNKSTKEKRPLKEYAAKVLMEIKGEESLDSYVEFAVNIDIDSWQPQVDELRKKLPRRLLWGTDDDALEDVRQHIKGMTLPQVYMKTKGCWTGGHQENLRFCSVNVNHGPGNCEWWAMDTRCTDAFRAKVLEDFHYDIFYQETLWWPDEDWCMANGFKLYYAVQKPGDIIFVGVGTLHWVRSITPTVNSAWNLGLKSLKQFAAAFDRFSVNETISFRSIVPLHNLALDLLNFDLPNLPHDLTLLFQEKVMSRFHLEEAQLKKALKKKDPLVDTTENVVSCEYCNKEILYAYVKCWSCQVMRLKGLTEAGTFYCIACYENHECSLPRMEFIRKFEPHELKLLKTRVDNFVNKGLGSEVQDGLDYQYEKYANENIYKSPYEGIDNLICIVENATQGSQTPKGGKLQVGVGLTSASLTEGVVRSAEEGVQMEGLELFTDSMQTENTKDAEGMRIGLEVAKESKGTATVQRRPSPEEDKPDEKSPRLPKKRLAEESSLIDSAIHDGPTKKMKQDEKPSTELSEPNKSPENVSKSTSSKPQEQQSVTKPSYSRHQYHNSKFEAEDLILIPKKQTSN